MPRARVGIVVMVAVAVGLTACGGSSAAKSPTGTEPAGSGQPGTTTAGSSKNTAPDALVVAKLVSAADLTAAFSQPIAGLGDDGGVSTSGQGFSSQATLATHNATLTITLTSAPSASQAAEFYSEFVPPSTPAPVPLPGVGDKAVAGNGTVIVLKGAQVLRIAAQPSVAVQSTLDNAKQNNTITPALIASAQALPLHDAETAARAIAAKLSGASAAATLTYLPAGALDPCGFDPSLLNNGDIKVTSAPAISDVAPASECVYTFTGSKPTEPGAGQLAAYTLTAAQAAAAKPPTTPAAAYAATLKEYGGHNGSGSGSGSTGGQAPFGSDSSGPLDMAGMTRSEPDFALLQGPASVPFHQVNFRVDDYRSSYVIDARHCYDEIAKMFNEMQQEAAAHGNSMDALAGKSAADAARAKLARDISDWCKAEAEPNEQPPSP